MFLDQQTSQVIEVTVSLGWIEMLSLVTGIASLALAVLAIWLSIKFYQMSNKSSEKINESSNNINNNVQKLEKMFDTMYSDTFGMVKDTVSHMRQQVDNKSNGIDTLTIEVDKRIAEAVSEQLKDYSADTITKEEAKRLVMSMVNESKEIEIEVTKSSLEADILSILRRKGEQIYGSLYNEMLGKHPSDKMNGVFFDTVYDMAQKGIIEDYFIKGKHGEISIEHSSPIRIKK